MWVITIAVLILSVFHLLLGLISVCVGVTSSIRAEVWLAHSVSPIWSGGFFIITGILGFACSKKKTAYMIMCFTAFNIVSLVTAIVSIQLLRLGLVNHTTDGHTFQKEHKDVLILVALGAAGVECLICAISSFVSCRLAKAAKKELQKKREETFHVQDGTEESQEIPSNDNNAHEFYHTADSHHVAPLHDGDKFTCLACSAHDMHGSDDFLKPWDMSTFGSSNLHYDSLNRTTNDRSCDRPTTGYINRDPDVNNDIEMCTLDESSPNEIASTNNDRTNVYTISSCTDNTEIWNKEHRVEVAIENNIPESEIMNDTVNGGEKPRLKRILSLIADERGSGHSNSNNNANSVHR